MTDNSKQAWVDAVAAGETTDSFADWWAERERDALSEDDDDPEMLDFTLRIGVTTRTFREVEFKAESMDKAIEHARTVRPSDHLCDIEGDELGYLRETGDFESDEKEIDMRQGEGEPFSWDACEIVKKLAVVNISDSQAVANIIGEAITACQKVEGNV